MEDESEGSVVTLVESVATNVDVQSVVTVAAFVEPAEFNMVEDEIGRQEELERVVEENVEDVEEDEEDGNNEDFQFGGFLKVLKDSRLAQTKRTVLGKR